MPIWSVNNSCLLPKTNQSIHIPGESIRVGSVGKIFPVPTRTNLNRKNPVTGYGHRITVSTLLPYPGVSRGFLPKIHRIGGRNHFNERSYQSWWHFIYDWYLVERKKSNYCRCLRWTGKYEWTSRKQRSCQQYLTIWKLFYYYDDDGDDSETSTATQVDDRESLYGRLRPCLFDLGISNPSNEVDVDLSILNDKNFGYWIIIVRWWWRGAGQ